MGYQLAQSTAMLLRNLCSKEYRLKVQNIIHLGILALSALFIVSCHEIAVDGFNEAELKDQLVVNENLGPAILTIKFTVDSNVTNGAAYDIAALTGFDSVKVLEIPDSGSDVTTWLQEDISIQIKKVVSFGGHPGYPITPVQARKNMGVALKRKGDTLIVATFGEWSCMEGGASLQMKIRAPETVTIVKSSSLNGEYSAAIPAEHPVINYTDSTFWYTITVPGNGWEKIDDIPDTLGVGW
jgi:hypothetical protein